MICDSLQCCEAAGGTDLQRDLLSVAQLGFTQVRDCRTIERRKKTGCVISDARAMDRVTGMDRE